MGDAPVESPARQLRNIRRRTLLGALTLLGAAAILWLPLVHLASQRRGEAEPGQARPVLFFSPDCDECIRSEPLISQLLQRQGWIDVVRLDARRVSSLFVRNRFDATFRVAAHLRGHTPALFHASGAVIGYDQFHAASLTGLPQAEPGPAESSGFPWGGWANFVIIGLCLLVMAGTLGHYAPQARLAGVLLLAAIFLIAGIGKVLAPAAFVQTVVQMNLFPLPLARATWLLGPMEIGLGAALLLPRWRRAALGLTLPLLTSFLGLYVLLWTQGYDGNCGCFPAIGGGRLAGSARALALSGLTVAMIHGSERLPTRSTFHECAS